MSEFLLLGSALGGIIGIAHAVSVFRQIAARNATGCGPCGVLLALCYALWTVALWTIFGAYVLAFWILGVIGYPIVRLLRGSGAAGRTSTQLEHAR